MSTSAPTTPHSGRLPVVVMCYANVILARGLERFADALVESSVSGLIVPDLPLEEAQETFEACEARGLALVPLVAPTTPHERLVRIGKDCAAHLKGRSRSVDHGDLLYDDKGLPR